MHANPVREAVQWFALLGAALAWAGQHVVGLGLGLAHCSVAGQRWGFDQGLWETTLTASAAFLAVLAEIAAIWLFLQLRGHDNEPPGGRHVFFAYAAVPGNVIFIALILLSGIGSLYHLPCRQALGVGW